MSENTEIREDYIEEMASLYEGFGMPPMFGRVFAALLIADPYEKTAQQLADELKASRGAISGALKMLELSQMISRRKKPGDRKEYFSNKPNAWGAGFIKKIMAITLLKELAEKGLRIVDSDDPKVTRGLRDMRDMMIFSEKEMLAMWERWTELQAKKKESGDL